MTQAVKASSLGIFKSKKYVVGNAGKDLETFIFNVYRVWSTFSYPGVNAKKKKTEFQIQIFL